MKLLLDTHVLLWALVDDPALPPVARRLICDEDNLVYFSAISLWEVQIKHQAHPDKLAFGARQVIEYCAVAGYTQLPVKAAHAELLATLKRRAHTLEHKDPFDRMLICQAAAEGMILLTSDRRIAEYVNPCILAV